MDVEKRYWVKILQTDNNRDNFKLIDKGIRRYYTIMNFSPNSPVSVAVALEAAIAAAAVGVKAPPPLLHQTQTAFHCERGKNKCSGTINKDQADSGLNC